MNTDNAPIQREWLVALCDSTLRPVSLYRIIFVVSTCIVAKLAYLSAVLRAVRNALEPLMYDT